MMRFKRSTGLCVVLVIALGSPTVHAAEPNSGVISEVGAANWATVPSVPENLPWKQATISDAKRVLSALERILTEEIAALKAAGAVRLRTETKSPGWPDFWLQTTKHRWSMTRYVGLNSASRIVASTPWDPATNVFYSRHLVGLNASACSLREFSFFDLSTWFETKCQLQSTTPQKLLSASLQELLGQGPRDLPAYTDFELEKLDYALKHNLVCKESANLLRCENLGLFTSNGGPDSVNLRTESGGWDYEIAVNIKRHTASIKYLRPRPRLFAKKTDWRLSDFFEGNSKTPKLIYP